MTPYFFAIYASLALVAAGVSFLPLSRARTGAQSSEPGDKNAAHIRRRRLLYIGCVAAFFPIVVKIIFCLFPLLEARIIPVGVYGAIQGEFWLPFPVLFFALVSHLVPSRDRKGVVIIVFILVVLVVQQTSWHLSKPEAYDYQGPIIDGVCLQTSGDTCGPASMVTLLNAMGIQTTEGEMARLSLSAPGRGLSPHQAAYALRKKFQELGRREEVTIEVPGIAVLDGLPKPFLAGIRYSFWTNHMVCILKTTEQFILVADPLSGRQPWTWKRFEAEWSGIAVVVHY